MRTLSRDVERQIREHPEKVRAAIRASREGEKMGAPIVNTTENPMPEDKQIEEFARWMRDHGSADSWPKWYAQIAREAARRFGMSPEDAAVIEAAEKWEEWSTMGGGEWRALTPPGNLSNADEPLSREAAESVKARCSNAVGRTRASAGLPKPEKETEQSVTPQPS